MQSAKHRHLLAVAALCLAGAAAAAAEEKSTYGKVDTFEPGKKYSCLPTADHKAWDCTQTGKASEHPAPATAPAAVAPPTAPPAGTSNVQQPAPATSAPSAPATHSSELPGYLSASAASGGPVPRQPGVPPPSIPAAKAATPANPPPAPAPAQQPVVTAPTPEPVSPPPKAEPAPASVAATPAAPPAPKPEPAPAKPESPPPAPVAAQPPPRHDTATRSDAAFLALPPDQYVIELAHAGSESEIDSSSVLSARGDVYKLHLRQNGADVWLLVCGSFDDVAGARAARAEIAAAAAVAPGWPRRIGPLQAEVRRVKE